ncbi:MAG: hypothetical protein JWR19_1921 [Pedosphaera sp.]|nr:hypothetical protein [Pedosphaera sp.]
MLKLLQLPKNKAFASIRPDRRRLAALCLAIFIFTALAASAANFTATLDRDTITLGENATLTLTFEGGSPKTFPTLPAIPNLQFANQGEASQFTMVNGQVTASQSHTFAVTPGQVGEFNLPAFSAEIGGQAFKTQPLKLTVLAPGTAAPATAGQPAANNPSGAFLKLIVPKNEVYLGEILPLEIQLYVQMGKLAEMPHFKEEGFTLGKMLQPTESQTILNNQRFNVVVFKTYVIAAKTGKLDLGPATMAFNVPAANSRRNFFGEYVDWQSITLQSEPTTLSVLPLPKEGVPPGFNGGVGDFSLTTTVSPTNIAVGDPLVIKVQLTGHGNLDALTLPDQPAWQQFKVYPPTSDFQPADPLGLSGTKNFALTAVPENMDIREVPPFSFSFFDPEQKCYRTLTQPSVPLTVRPSMASLPPPATSKPDGAAENASPASKDIVHIKPRPGVLAEIQSPLAIRPWFISLQGIPVIAWLALLIGRKQKERLANNPRLRRKYQVEQTIRNGLKELRQSAAANQADAFFATLFRLLQEQLGERLDLPASAITEAVVEERLRPNSLPEETLAALHELFQTCNQERYAHHSTNQELVSLIPRVESALNQIKELKA